MRLVLGIHFTLKNCRDFTKYNRLKDCVEATYIKDDYFRDSWQRKLIPIVKQVERYTLCLNFIVLIPKYLPLFALCMDGKVLHTPDVC